MFSATNLTADLLQLPSLSGLTRPAAEAILSGSATRTLQPGATLFAEGDEGTHLYLVLDGRLQVTCSTDDGNTEVVVGLVGQGAVLGEMGLLGGMVRSASVRANTACRLLEVSGQHLESLIEEGHHAAWILLRAMRTQLVRRLRTVDERVDAVLEPTLPQRDSTRLRNNIAALWHQDEEQ